MIPARKILSAVRKNEGAVVPFTLRRKGGGTGGGGDRMSIIDAAKRVQKVVIDRSLPLEIRSARRVANGWQIELARPEAPFDGMNGECFVTTSGEVRFGWIGVD